MAASRDELHNLIDELPDDHVSAVAEELRRRARPRSASTAKPFAWVGAGVTKDGATDVSQNADEYLASFARDFGALEDL